MKMKKFEASSLTEAMKKVRAELGEDAVILKSRTVYSKGILGLFRKRTFEVTAGVDTLQPARGQRPPAPAPSVQMADASVLKELGDLKELMTAMQRKQSTPVYPEPIEAVRAKCQRQGLADELITELCDGLFVQFREGRQLEGAALRQQVAAWLDARLADLPFGGLAPDSRYVNVLGPTGVGKTTTIAKIAARSVLERKKKVGFLTTDTYRIAAIEQLKVYAGLLQSPVEVVYTAEDYKSALESLQSLDLVLIDTAGRNYKEAKYVEDLTALIDYTGPIEAFLVLSATSKESDMEAVLDRFSSFRIEKLIATKVDETNSIGPIVNLMVKYKKGLAYYTNGQEVPEDIVEVTRPLFVSYFLEEIFGDE